MIVKNPNGLLSESMVKSAKKNMDDIRDLLQVRVSQRESRMKLSIYKILATIFQNEEMNLSIIKKKTGLSWRTITKNQKFLVEKRIIAIKQYKDKENNAKFCRLNINRAVVYLDHLFNYKKRFEQGKDDSKWLKSFVGLLERVAPKDFWQSYVFLDPKVQKQWNLQRDDLMINQDEIQSNEKTPLFLKKIRENLRREDPNNPRCNYWPVKSLPISLIKELLYKLNTGNFCESCRKNSGPLVSTRCNNPKCNIVHCENCRKLFDRKTMKRYDLLPITDLIFDDQLQANVCRRCGAENPHYEPPARVKGIKKGELGSNKNDEKKFFKKLGSGENTRLH